MNEKAMIYGLIGQAMQEIGAIGKDSRNEQQKFMYRGIDAVMNALNPVMSKLGLFMVPEVLEQVREERVNKNGTNLLYSVLRIKYTLFAPDGSNVSAVVIGEGMDTGDKASNKALSVGFKYAAFQLFCIPTEEMIDPDAECHEVKPRGGQQGTVKTTATQVIMTPTVPPIAPPAPASPVLEYLAKEREALRVVREIGKAENNAIWKAQVAALTAAGIAPDKPLTDYTMNEAETLISSMYNRFAPKGTVLRDAGEPS